MVLLLLLLWIPIPSSSCALWMAITRTVRKMVWVLGKGFFTGLVRMSIPWICCCGMYVSLQNPILCCMILSCWTCSWERLKQEHYYKIEAFVVARVLFNANKSRVWNHLCFCLQIKSKQTPLRFSFVISRQTNPFCNSLCLNKIHSCNPLLHPVQQLRNSLVHLRAARKKCLVQFGRRKCSEPHANCAQFGASQS